MTTSHGMTAESDEESKPLYYVSGDVVCKRSVGKRNADGTGTNYTLGFPVCTASEYIAAETLAGFMNEEEASAAEIERLTDQRQKFATMFYELQASERRRDEYTREIEGRIKAAESKLNALAEPVGSEVAKSIDLLTAYSHNELRFTQVQRERLKEAAALIRRLSSSLARVRGVVALCAKTERDMFRALDRFGDSIAANWGQPLVPIPMDEMLNVASAKAEMIVSMAQAEAIRALNQPEKADDADIR